MPMSATGPCSARAAASARGFTLIELLVVLVILGVLSVAVALSTSPDPRRAAGADAERLALLLEAAGIETQAGGAQLAWSSQEDSYSFWVSRDQHWQVPNEDDRFGTRRLSEGLHIDRVEIDGLLLPAGELLIFRRGSPPLFHIFLNARNPADRSNPPDRQDITIELRGSASGRVEVLTAGTS